MKNRDEQILNYLDGLVCEGFPSVCHLRDKHLDATVKMVTDVMEREEVDHKQAVAMLETELSCNN